MLVQLFMYKNVNAGVYLLRLESNYSPTIEKLLLIENVRALKGLP